MRLHVASAAPQERDAALRVFFQHLPDDERHRRVDQTLTSLASGSLPGDGLLVCRSEEGLVGVITALPLAGAAALVWPPQIVDGGESQAIEQRLVHSALAWVRHQGAKFAQAFLPAADLSFAAPLTRHGFQHITTLLYLQKDLSSADDHGPDPPRLYCQNYTTCNLDLFQTTLLESYEGTRDCPELNGVRTGAEIVAGYQAIPGCWPQRWWLAWHEGQPVGVLITMPVQDSLAWELGYVGLTPRARRRGFGRELTLQAMREAHAAGAPHMILTVDARNEPARQLYGSLGFKECDRREVLLCLALG